MRFCDKLSKIRKNNNLSQEQLADRLGVSRQAVSKWEQGLSHPDMDKIIQMCKILDCTLEELMDDDIIGGNLKKEKNNTIVTYFNDFLSFLTKVSNMFSCMKFKEKIKCITEMLFIGFILFSIGLIILLLLDSITCELLSIIPYSIQHRLSNLLVQIYLIGLIILGLVIFIHLFKVRYLNYYVTIEDTKLNEEKEVNIKEEIIIPKKETIIIRDPKHSSFSFIKLLGKIFSFMVKMICSLFLIPLLLLFILIITGSIVVFYHIIYGNIFIALSFICIGLIVLFFMLIKLIINVFFNSKLSFKRIFIVFILSIIMIGVGSGLTIVSFTSYSTTYNYDDLKKNENIEYIEIKDNTSIYAPGNIEYIIDNTISNAKIEVTTIDGVNYRTHFNNDAYSTFYQIYITDIDYSKIYEMVINDLKNKVIRNYNSNSDFITVKIYISEENYKKLNNYYYNY